MRIRNGFTLLDLVAAVAVLGVGAAVFAQVAAPARRGAMGVRSMQNLSLMGQMASAYTDDYNGRLSAYSWEAGREYVVPGAVGGSPVTTNNDVSARGYQNTEILRRLTGRVDTPEINGPGTGEIRLWDFRLVDRRRTHLVLVDYWGLQANHPVLASPGDRNLQRWQADPFDLSTVPYAEGSPDPSLYDVDPNWGKLAMKQRWPYASSYQFVHASWSPDTFRTYAPVPYTPHLSWAMSSSAHHVPLGGRRMRDVVFPGNKVWIHEEFDWMPWFDAAAGEWRSDGLWCTYDRARGGKLMFDGSVNTRPAGEANSSWTPADPTGPVWKQKYVPLDTFPLPVGDFGREIDQRFRWTRGGLAGFDYGPAGNPGPLELLSKSGEVED